MSANTGYATGKPAREIVMLRRVYRAASAWLADRLPEHEHELRAAVVAFNDAREKGDV